MRHPSAKPKNHVIVKIEMNQNEQVLMPKSTKPTLAEKCTKVIKNNFNHKQQIKRLIKISEWQIVSSVEMPSHPVNLISHSGNTTGFLN